MKTLLTILLLPALLVAAAQEKSPAQDTPAPSPAVRTLPLPDVPVSLREPKLRAAYLLEHFWDGVDFADTLLLRDTEALERHTVDFLALFPHADTSARTPAAEHLLRRAGADAEGLRTVAGMVEKYLYEPESPLFDETLYRVFLEAMLHSGLFDPYETMRYRYQAGAIDLNRPGTRAADFEYEDRRGRRHRLSEFGAERLLLVLYDPSCDHCTEVLGELEALPELRAQCASGKTAVLRIFADGTREEWRDDTATLPAGWTDGLDVTGLQERERYLPRSLPALYLLDRDKTVLWKEPPVGRLAEYLR